MLFRSPRAGKAAASTAAGGGGGGWVAGGATAASRSTSFPSPSELQARAGAPAPPRAVLAPLQFVPRRPYVPPAAPPLSPAEPAAAHVGGRAPVGGGAGVRRRHGRAACPTGPHGGRPTRRGVRHRGGGRPGRDSCGRGAAKADVRAMAGGSGPRAAAAAHGDGVNGCGKPGCGGRRNGTSPLPTGNVEQARERTAVERRKNDGRSGRGRRYRCRGGGAVAAAWAVVAHHDGVRVQSAANATQLPESSTTHPTPLTRKTPHARVTTVSSKCKYLDCSELAATESLSNIYNTARGLEPTVPFLCGYLVGALSQVEHISVGYTAVNRGHS